MLCMCTHTSIQTFQIPWTILNLQCFTQAEKTSFSTCVAETKFLPDWRKYHQYFFLRNKSRFFFFLLPSLPSMKAWGISGARSSRGHGRNESQSRWCPSLSWCCAWCLVEITSLQGSVNTSCHMNVNIFGWPQMRSQGVSGCFGNQPLPLLVPDQSFC